MLDDSSLMDQKRAIKAFFVAQKGGPSVVGA